MGVIEILVEVLNLPVVIGERPSLLLAMIGSPT